MASIPTTNSVMASTMTATPADPAVERMNCTNRVAKHSAPTVTEVLATVATTATWCVTTTNSIGTMPAHGVVQPSATPSGIHKAPFVRTAINAHTPTGAQAALRPRAMVQPTAAAEPAVAAMVQVRAI